MTPAMPDRLIRFFPSLLGAFFGLALLKFGNPPIMERWVEPPSNIYEFMLGSPWPISWAYGLLIFLAVAGVLVLLARKPRDEFRPITWMALLPLPWLAWQALATSQSVSAQLSVPTLKHFIACAVCFYLGFALLSRTERLGSFWTGLFCGFVLVLVLGWQQHFGGLEATRQFFFREIYPHLKEVPPDYLKKMSSNRIFSTLFYPNALAGALLLLLPIMLAFISQARTRFTLGARGFLCGALVLGAMGCLYWSGSKGGWLLMLLLLLIVLLRLRFSRALKAVLLVGVLAGGLAGFLWKYASFFERGATSVGARLDYWQAAFKTAAAHPWTGTGPGTFMIPYAAIKRPESEMTRMVHNDFLEQASDSGWLGFAAYLVLVPGGLVLAGRSILSDSRTGPGNAEGEDWMTFCIWLGVLGWAVQGAFEFGLYIPALAWPAFAFLGYLTARSAPRRDRIQSTKPGSVASFPARHENTGPKRPKP